MLSRSGTGRFELSLARAKRRPQIPRPLASPIPFYPILYSKTRNSLYILNSHYPRPFISACFFSRIRQWNDEERRLRALAPRRCVDIAGSIMQHVIARPYTPTAGGDPPAGTGGAPWSIQPHSTYVRRMLPPAALRSNPATGVCTQAKIGGS